MDASAALAFNKIERLADAGGFDLVIAGVSDRVEHQLARGGVVAGQGALRFEPDLDRALQRCEELLLDEVDPAQAPATTDGSDDGAAALPPGVAPYLERVTLEGGDVLIHQGDPSEDVFVLVSGRLRVERSTPEGMRVRLSTVRRGVVGEVALYTGAARTADVVAEAPSVVLRLRRAALERMEVEDPQVAAALPPVDRDGAGRAPDRVAPHALRDARLAARNDERVDRDAPLRRDDHGVHVEGVDRVTDLGREQGQPDDRVRDRLDVGRRRATDAVQQRTDREPVEQAHRARAIHRRQREPAITQDLHQHPTGRHQHQRAERRVAHDAERDLDARPAPWLRR